MSPCLWVLRLTCYLQLGKTQLSQLFTSWSSKVRGQRTDLTARNRKRRNSSDNPFGLSDLITPRIFDQKKFERFWPRRRKWRRRLTVVYIWGRREQRPPETQEQTLGVKCADLSRISVGGGAWKVHQSFLRRVNGDMWKVSSSQRQKRGLCLFKQLYSHWFCLLLFLTSAEKLGQKKTASIIKGSESLF